MHYSSGRCDYDSNAFCSSIEYLCIYDSKYYATFSFDLVTQTAYTASSEDNVLPSAQQTAIQLVEYMPRYSLYNSAVPY